MQYKESWWTVDLCSARSFVKLIGVYSRCAPAPPKPITFLRKSLAPLHPNPYRFSPLASLQREGPGWCTPTEYASSQIHHLRIWNSVRKYCYLFSFSHTFLWDTPKILCLLSIGCSYLFRLFNQNRGIKDSTCVHHIFLAAVANTYSR